MTDGAANDDRQQAAEAEVDAFRQKLGPFVVAAEATRMAMAFTDARKAGNPIIFANDSFLKLTGYDRAELLAQPFDFVLPPEAAAQVRAEIDAAFKTSATLDSEIRFRRKDGSQGWAGLFVTPVRDERGTVVQHFLSLADTTRYKLAEQNAALLIDELNHRVRNTLANVNAIIAQGFRGSGNLGDIRHAIDARVAALAHAHDLLSRNSWEGVGLCDLVVEIMRPAGKGADRGNRHTVTGENLRLRPKATISLGMALNELLSNAARFGALSNETGSVGLDWAINPTSSESSLSLRWQEHGGPPVSAPVHKGFGSRILERGLPHELGGRTHLEYAAEGLICTIDLPASRVLLDA